MLNNVYKYYFKGVVPTQDLKETFKLAVLAVECLHGPSRVRIEDCFYQNIDDHYFAIDTFSDIGRDLVLIFTGFATKK